jgi:hypothetical protein
MGYLLASFNGKYQHLKNGVDDVLNGGMSDGQEDDLAESYDIQPNNTDDD